MEYEAYRRRSDKGIKKAAPAKEGQRGYQPSHREKKEHTQPQEVTALKTGDNLISFGVSRKKEVTMTVSTAESRTLKEDQVQVRMDQAVRAPDTKGKIWTNSHDPKRSAVAAKEDLKKQRYGLEGRLWQMAKKLSGSEVVEDVLPFLIRGREQEKGTPEYMHRQQEQEKLRQEIAASMEKLKKKAEESAKKQHGTWTRIVPALLEEAEKEDGEEDRQEEET